MTASRLAFSRSRASRSATRRCGRSACSRSTIAPAERVAIIGLDAGGAEVLVNLVTGRSVPTAGAVRVLGSGHAEIADGDEWLASLDRFGIVSERAVLLDGATVEQNLAMPFTLRDRSARAGDGGAGRGAGARVRAGGSA